MATDKEKLPARVQRPIQGEGGRPRGRRSGSVGPVHEVLDPRHARPPAGRPPEDDRRGALRLRRAPAGHALREDPPLPAARRDGEVDRPLGGAAIAPECGRSLAIAKPGEKMRFAGQEVAAVAAETPEQAIDALVGREGRVRGAPLRGLGGRGAQGRRPPRVREGPGDEDVGRRRRDVLGEDPAAQGQRRRAAHLHEGRRRTRRSARRTPSSSRAPTGRRSRTTRRSRRTASSRAGRASSSPSGPRPRASSRCATSSPRRSRSRRPASAS